MNVDLNLSESDYQALAEFRYQVRRFLHFSEQAARDAGLEPQQHQLLLAIRGLPPTSTASIGELADRLQLQHHSTVELVSRMAERGLLERHRDAADLRRVIVTLTSRGEQLLGTLSLLHRIELRSTAPALVRALIAITGSQESAREREG
jgi:DNA-binding MarR family transcriptional regulator